MTERGSDGLPDRGAPRGHGPRRGGVDLAEREDQEGAGLKVVEVTPELIAEMLSDYSGANPNHVEGGDGLVLHVATNSWRAFEKKVGA